MTPQSLQSLIEKLNTRAHLAQNEDDLIKDDFNAGLAAGFREAIYELRAHIEQEPAVSLDECVEAVCHAWRTANKCNASERDTEIMITKAALDKAGVKYV